MLSKNAEGEEAGKKSKVKVGAGMVVRRNSNETSLPVWPFYTSCATASTMPDCSRTSGKSSYAGTNRD